MNGSAGPPAGRIAALYRHPVKGFTPERLDEAALRTGEVFPGDRLYAVERGDSGFDARAPRHISKQRFAVLANHPGLARARTRYDDTTAVLEVQSPGRPPLSADLRTEEGRARFAARLQETLGEEEPLSLRVLAAPDGFRFTDHREGFVSLLNLASVRDIGRRAKRSIDPLRFRANVHVEGWPAWRELEIAPGTRLSLGPATLEVIQPITRCIATHVDPSTGERDLDMLGELHRHYGHPYCGLYLRVLEGGVLREGDDAPLPAIPEPASCPPPSSKPGPPRATA